MKKLLLATVFTGISTLAVANVGTDGLYVQGNVGVFKLQIKDGGKIKDTGTAFGVAVGNDFGSARVALDYTNYGKLKDSQTDGADTFSQESKVQSFGLSGIYDFNTVSGFTPYAGLRVGVNQLKLSWNDLVDGVREVGSIKKTKVGAGAVLGAQYAINPNLLIDGALEYNHLGKIKDGNANFKFNQHGVKVGLRYNF